MSENSHMNPRDYVQTISSSGKANGLALKADAHDWPGILHLAFSVFLQDERGRIVLQRRSDKKRLWPMTWSNSCCSHPMAEESAFDAVDRRVREELGAPAHGLQQVSQFQYQANYKELGTESEICCVWLGLIESEALAPDPDEVEAVSFLYPDQLTTAIFNTPCLFTPWMTIGWGLVRALIR